MKKKFDWKTIILLVVFFGAIAASLINLIIVILNR